MTTLYEIIGVCTDITEMSIAQITAQPKICVQWVQRVQEIGKVWDEHPDWHGRNWYVQVLLAVASLSRVVEWWEAEKQFWNFDDEDEEESAEPFTFLLKPNEEVAPTPRTLPEGDPEGERRVVLSADDEARLRLTRNSSQTTHIREETHKAHPTENDMETADTLRKGPDLSESARVLATERLRLQAEQAQSQNIVLELNLDGDHLIWVNHAWEVVVGCAY